MAREWLRKLRVEKFGSQMALAVASGVPQSRVSLIENGYSEIRPSEIEGLARALGLSIDEIRTGKVEVKPAGLAAAKAAPATSAPVGAAAVCSDLADPKNFNLLPRRSLLSRSATEADRAEMRREIEFGEKVLHTSRVPAAVWREWRDFCRDANAWMRGEQPAKVIASVPVPAAVVAPAKPVLATPKAPPAAGEGNTRLRGNKNVFGHFADVARAWLSPAQLSALEAKATAAKAAAPDVGFMKHFRRIAGEVLTPAEFQRIDQEATRRAV